MDRLVVTAQERFWNPEPFARDQWVKAQAASLPAGSWVLDAGAGASKYRPFFGHCRYETQDFCQYEGELVKYREPITHVCDITAIPLPDASLDAILCTEVFEHVVDPMRVLEEFARLLKPGGRLFLTAPLLSHLHMEPFHFYGGFTHYWYRHWLPLRGFDILSLEAIGGPGTTASIFAKCFYVEWGAAERKLPSGVSRWASLFARMLSKPFVHYVWPWLLPKFDGWLGSGTICSGYMVSAARRPSEGGGGGR